MVDINNRRWDTQVIITYLIMHLTTLPKPDHYQRIVIQHPIDIRPVAVAVRIGVATVTLTIDVTMIAVRRHHLAHHNKTQTLIETIQNDEKNQCGKRIGLMCDV